MTAPLLAPKAALLQVLWQHGVSAKGPSDTACRCDRTWRTDEAYRAHVVDELSRVVVPVEELAEDEALVERVWQLRREAIEAGVGDRNTHSFPVPGVLRALAAALTPTDPSEDR